VGRKANRSSVGVGKDRVQWLIYEFERDSPKVEKTVLSLECYGQILDECIGGLVNRTTFVISMECNGATKQIVKSRANFL